MTQRFVNNFSTTVAATFGAADTFLQVASTAGLPTLAAGEYLLLTVFKKVGADESAHEVVKVTDIVANQLTVQRGIEGTAPAMFLTGDRVEARFTAAGAGNLVQRDELAAHALDQQNPHGVTAAQVGADPAGTATSAVTAHEGAVDPHPQYTTQGEAAAAAPVQSVAGKVGAVILAKGDVDLGNVDNTADLDKPISTATQAALDAKQATLVSGTNIKTINGASLLGSGGIAVGTGDVTLTGTQTLTNKTVEAGVFTNGYTEEVATANTGTAYTIDLADGSVQILTLTGNVTYMFPTAVAGKSFLLVQKQDATGSRTATWPAAVKWPGSTAPTLTSTASKADVFAFTCDGTNWFGRVIGQAYL